MLIKIRYPNTVTVMISLKHHLLGFNFLIFIRERIWLQVSYPEYNPEALSCACTLTYQCRVHLHQCLSTSSSSHLQDDQFGAFSFYHNYYFIGRNRKVLWNLHFCLSPNLTLKTCNFQTPRLAAQREFMSALIAVGKRLTSLPTKDLKSKLRMI